MEPGADSASPKTVNRYRRVADTASILNIRIERLVLGKAEGDESISGHSEVSIYISEWRWKDVTG